MALSQKWKVIISLCVFAALYEIYWKFRLKRRKLPPGPSSLMRLYALIKLFLQKKSIMNEFEFARWNQQNYGKDGIIYQSIFGIQLTFIYSTNVAKQILNNKNALDRPIFGDPHNELHIESTADGTMPFANLNGKEWEKRRKLSQSILFRMCTTDFVGKILDETMTNIVIKELNKICNENKLWFPSSLMKYCAFNTIFYANCGKHISFDDPLYHPIVNAITETFELFQSGIILSVLPKWLLFFIKILPIPQLHNDYYRIIKLIKTRHVYSERFSKYFEKKEEQKEKEKEDNKEEGKYYVDYINNELTESEALADAQALFGAGTDTTSSTLNFAIIFAAKYENIQNKVRNELIDCYNNNNNKTSIDKIESDDNIRRFNMNWINQLTYFRAFIYETLRVSSITKAGLPHYTTKDIHIIGDNNNKYIIPKGVIIGYNIELMHKLTENRENWTNSSNEMCLENWINKNTNKFEINPSFITFGIGRRDCVGRTLALKEIYIIIAYLLLNFKFSFKNPNDIQIKTKWKGVNIIHPPIGVIVKRL